MTELQFSSKWLCTHQGARSIVMTPEGKLCGTCAHIRARKAYNPTVLRREHRPLRVGGTTLVGIIDLPGDNGYPKKRGNCCGVINMYTENVEEALRRWPELGESCEMEVVEIRGHERLRVVDERLPVEWRRAYCVACSIFEDDTRPMPTPADDMPPPDDPPRKLGAKWSMESVEDMLADGYND